MPPAMGVLPPESPVAAPRGVTDEAFLAADRKSGPQPLDILGENSHVGKPWISGVASYP